MEDLVSVIIPTYNRVQWLFEAIESIAKQTYRPIEVVVVSDCGVEVKPILEKVGQLYPDISIQYIRHNTNKGPSAARNTGIRLSKGSYIAFLDDDDLFYPNHLEILVNCLKNSEYKIAYSWAKIFKYTSENGKIKREELGKYNYEFSKERLLIENYIPVNAFLIKRSLLVEEGFWFDESLRVLEDYELWLRLSRKYDFLCVPEFTCEVRDFGSSLSKDLKNIYLNHLLLYKKYPVDKKNNILYLSRNKRYNLYKAFLYLNEKKDKLKKVSIVIFSFNELEFIDGIINKVLYANSYYNIELVLVNVDTREEFLKKLNNYLKNKEKEIGVVDIEFIFSRKKMSLAKALNLGAVKARGDLLVFVLNSIPDCNSINSLIYFYEQRRNCGLVGGKTYAAEIFFEDWYKDSKVKIFGNDFYDLDNNKVESLEGIYSPVFLVSKDDYKRVNGFEESNHPLDSVYNFSSKINKMGKKVYYNPFAESYLYSKLVV